jgi:hypothetical protein
VLPDDIAIELRNDLARRHHLWNCHSYSPLPARERLVRVLVQREIRFARD